MNLGGRATCLHVLSGVAKRPPRPRINSCHPHFPPCPPCAMCPWSFGRTSSLCVRHRVEVSVQFSQNSYMLSLE
jgi:hypothetical protein